MAKPVSLHVKIFLPSACHFQISSVAVQRADNLTPNLHTTQDNRVHVTKNIQPHHTRTPVCVYKPAAECAHGLHAVKDQNRCTHLYCFDSWQIWQILVITVRACRQIFCLHRSRGQVRDKPTTTSEQHIAHVEYFLNGMSSSIFCIARKVLKQIQQTSSSGGRRR